MIHPIRDLMHRRNPCTGQRPHDDGGYAMLGVIGFCTATVMALSLLGGYALQGMDSARRSQDFHAALQAAEAGADRFLAQLAVPNSPELLDLADGTATGGWAAVPNSRDVNGTLCDPAAPARTCPQFRYRATSIDAGETVTVTSTGRSAGVERAVQVTARQRAFTDYLYYSEVEAAHPQDRAAYPFGAGPGCERTADGGRPAGTACVVPTWRDQDSTSGSRVHSADVFEAIGTPDFDSRVSTAHAACLIDPQNSCVRHTYDTTAAPDFPEGIPPGYADDLTMPANGLAEIANAADATGCVYYGPTRISFQGDQMMVLSPQTPRTTECGGGIPDDLLNQPVDVVVTTLNRAGVCDLLGAVTTLLCNLLAPIGKVVELPLSDVLGDSLLDDLGLLQTVSGLVSEGALVEIPAGSPFAIHVQDNLPAPQDAVPDPQPLQCLVATAVGMYSSLDTNLTEGADCAAGKLFIDGGLDGRDVTAGVAGDILIMSDLTHTDGDALGLVATGPIEVYNPMQCVLAPTTCFSLEDVDEDLLAGLTGLVDGDGNLLEDITDAVPGLNDDITIEASILSLQGWFGVQLPLLSPSLAGGLLNDLVDLGIDPPALKVHGSIAQQYRGILATDLLDVELGVAKLDALSANVDIGYAADYDYDEALRLNSPAFFPEPGTAIYDRVTFAEVPAGPAI